MPGPIFESHRIKGGQIGATCGIHEVGESYTQYSGRILMAGECLRCLNVSGRFVLNCALNEYNVSMWTGLNWLRIGTSDALL